MSQSPVIREIYVFAFFALLCLVGFLGKWCGELQDRLEALESQGKPKGFDDELDSEDLLGRE